MNRIGRYMEPEGGPLSWYSTMKNINDKGDEDFFENVARKRNSGLLSKLKGMFSKAQDAPLRGRVRGGNSYDNIQRPGLLGNYDGARSGFFKNVQDLFFGDKRAIGKRGNVHAVSRHHHFRNPEEGASRPGFITSAPQLDRPGFISGYGAASADTGAEILKESKSALTKMSVMVLVVGLFLFLKMR